MRAFPIRPHALFAVGASFGLLLSVGCTPSRPARPVEVHAFVMSACPFAAQAMQELLPGLEHLGGAAKLQIDYVGTLSAEGESSMYGPGDLYGDKLQLCARNLGDEAKWLRFVACQFTQGSGPNASWERCALKAELPEQGLRDCAEGLEGSQLLRASFERSKKAQVKASPSLYVDDQLYTGAHGEAALTRALCEHLSANRPSHCDTFSRPPRVQVTLLNDARCREPDCDVAPFTAGLRRALYDADVKNVDYGSADGKDLWKGAGEPRLPVAVFSPSLKQDVFAFRHLHPAPLADGRFLLSIGKTWNPSAEVCDDGRDNTGDGRIDCDDESCRTSLPCRAEEKNRIDLFVMAHCPYGARAIQAASEVASEAKRAGDQVSVRLGILASPTREGLRSPYGNDDLIEGMRFLCAQQHYAQETRYLEYVLCRTRNMSADWTTCLQPGMKREVMDTCVGSAEGSQLLSASAALAAQLGADRSPWGLVNARYPLTGLAPDQLRHALCSHNPTDALCSETRIVAQGE
jgi:hypothetical protein